MGIDYRFPYRSLCVMTEGSYTKIDALQPLLFTAP